MSDAQITKLEEVKEGDFVRFVDRDKSGRFTYVGEVINVQKAKKDEPVCFEMITFDGTMGFTFDAEAGFDAELYQHSTKPAGWAKFRKDPEKFKEAQKPEPAKPVMTKKQQVFELVKANPRKREAGLLTLAKKDIGGSPSQLKTYIQLALAKK